MSRAKGVGGVSGTVVLEVRQTDGKWVVDKPETITASSAGQPAQPLIALRPARSDENPENIVAPGLARAFETETRGY